MGAVVLGVLTTCQTPLSGHRSPVRALVPIGAFILEVPGGMSPTFRGTSPTVLSALWIGLRGHGLFLAVRVRVSLVGE